MIEDAGGRQTVAFEEKFQFGMVAHGCARKLVLQFLL